MSTLQMPTADHTQFDAMCAPVEDFEPLPTVVTKPAPEVEQESEDAPLDGLIFAGLVAPY